ncbi:hypothetical protein EON67_00070 [archaeon]|nr:MAG: hypothetical protein EON67_00070 [archaeon]
MFANLAGIACLIAGGVFYSRVNPNGRAEEIARYNAASVAWNGDSITSGLAAAWAAYGSMKLAATAELNMTLTRTYISPVPVEQGPGIMPYTTFASFVSTGTPFVINNLPWSGNAVAYPVTVKSASDAVLATPSIEFAWTRTYAKSKKSSCKYGSRQSSTCYVYLTPNNNGLCLALDGTTRAYSGPCSIADTYAAEAIAYSSTYLENKLYPVGYSAGSSKPGSITWPSGAPVVLRSANDPWVVAATDTMGQMVFGYRDAATMRLATILLGVGGGLMAPFFLIVFIVFCAVCAKQCRGLFSSGARSQTTFVHEFRATSVRAFSIVGRPVDVAVNSTTKSLRRITTRMRPSKRNIDASLSEPSANEATPVVPSVTTSPSHVVTVDQPPMGAYPAVYGTTAPMPAPVPTGFTPLPAGFTPLPAGFAPMPVGYAPPATTQYNPIMTPTTPVDQTHGATRGL